MRKLSFALLFAPLCAAAPKPYVLQMQRPAPGTTVTAILTCGTTISRAECHREVAKTELKITRAAAVDCEESVVPIPPAKSASGDTESFGFRLGCPLRPGDKVGLSSSAAMCVWPTLAQLAPGINRNSGRLEVTFPCKDPVELRVYDSSNNYRRPAIAPTVTGSVLQFDLTGITAANHLVMNANTDEATYPISVPLAPEPLGARAVIPAPARQPQPTPVMASLAPPASELGSAEPAPEPLQTPTAPATTAKPAITKIDKPTAAAGTTDLAVKITGENFGDGSVVAAPGITISDVKVVNSAEIDASFTIPMDARTGSVNVTVTDAGQSSAAVAESGFTVTAAPSAPDVVLEIVEGATAVSGFYKGTPNADHVAVEVKSVNATTEYVTGPVDPNSGKFTIPLTQPLSADATVVITGVKGTAGGRSVTEPVMPSAFDWGRVRAYFTFGIVLSANQTTGSGTSATANPFSTSSASPFIGFDIDKNWLLKQRARVNTYFDARLTQIGTSALSTTSNVGGLLANKQAASLQVGAYLPMVFTRWDFGGHAYSLYVAPLIKGGLYTAGNDQTSGVTSVNASNFYKFYGYGARVGHYRESRYWDGALHQGRAPEQLSYLDFMIGHWDNFQYADPLMWHSDGMTPPNLAPPCNVQAASTATANCILRQRPWRLGIEGLLNVPHTPFILGISANIAAQHPAGSWIAPPSDLRFLIGMRFDAKTLLQPLTALKPAQ